VPTVPTVPTVAPETTVPVSTSSTTVPSSLGPAEGSDDGSGAEVFGSKWFGDDDAYVPVAMWGFRLMVIAFVATAISRFTRRNWVGALVGIVPFVVCLYFFFEDLSRLLPANL
jgi:hypothetical protein